VGIRSNSNADSEIMSGVQSISRKQLVTSPPTTDFFVDGGW